jgi:hypothetical protein
MEDKKSQDDVKEDFLLFSLPMSFCLLFDAVVAVVPVVAVVAMPLL